MNERQQALYQRLREFEFSGRDETRGFADRLAEEQQWTPGFTARAMEEYRRYVLLACTSGHTDCPSEVVDEVWHLHLIYTRSYWQRFCGELLGQPLHHDPSRGGAAEFAKHRQMYSDSLALYRETLEQNPPADVWPDVDARFAGPPQIDLVDRSRYWLLPKPRWRQLLQGRSFLFAAVATTPLLAANSILDLRGPDFLVLYLCVAAVAFALGFTARALAQRGESVDMHDNELDAYEIAYLAGGEGRAVNAAVARLLHAGSLEMVQTNPPTLRLDQPDLAGTHPLEQTVCRATSQDGLGTQLREIHRECRGYFQPVKERMCRQGLLLSLPSAILGMGVPLTIILLVVVLGIGKIMVGLDRDKPVLFLVVLTAAVAFVGLLAFARPLFRTRPGDAYLTKLRRQHEGLENRARHYPGDLPAHQLATALGLWGCGLLGMTAFGATLDRYQSRAQGWNSGTGCVGGSYTSSACGGGGGGGGGCGGGGCGGGCGGCGGS